MSAARRQQKGLATLPQNYKPAPSMSKEVYEEVSREPTELDMRRVIPIFLMVFVDVLGLTVILPLLHLYAAAYGAGPLEVGLVVALSRRRSCLAFP